MRKNFSWALILILMTTVTLLPLTAPQVLAATSAASTTDAAAAGLAQQTTGTAGTVSTGSQVTGLGLPVVDVNGKPVAAGILPDSPLYWLTNVIEKIQVWFTFNPAQKVALVQAQALEKLAVAQEMAAKGKGQLAGQALADFVGKEKEAGQFAEQMKGTQAGTFQQLQAGLAKTYAGNIEVIAGLLKTLPPQTASQTTENVAHSLAKTVAGMNQAERKLVKTAVEQDSPGLKKQLNQAATTALTDLEKTLVTTAEAGQEGVVAKETSPKSSGVNQAATMAVERVGSKASGEPEQAKASAAESEKTTEHKAVRDGEETQKKASGNHQDEAGSKSHDHADSKDD